MRFSSLSAFQVACGLALFGCGVQDVGAPGEVPDDGAEDVALGETEQSVAWTAGSFHSCTTGTCFVDLGPSSDRTCFLAGIWGSLSNASASILSYADGRVRLRLGTPVGQRIGAMAMCVAGNTHAIDAFWTAGHAATPINGTVTSSRRCFLTEIDNNVSVRGFDNTTDFARVWKDSSGQWFLGGSVASSAGTRAAATCVDIPDDMGTWGIVAGAGAGNTVGFDLAENVGGVVCGLTKLGGNFTTNSLSDGLGIDYDAGTRLWNIKAVNGKQATAICVR
jgi:hypothetical protein